MTKYELLKACASVCEMLTRNGIDAADVRHLQMIEDFERMKGEGHKTSFIVYYLSRQYEVSEATVYRVAKRLAEECRL